MATNNKTALHNQLLQTVNQRIASIQQDIAGLKEARNNDTKSSAGDKYETGRQMMQIELDRLESSLAQTLHLKTALNQIKPNSQFKKVELGSLVTTNNGIYYISIGAGKIEVKNKTYYAISLASPIGKLLNGKTVGNSFEFNGKKYGIISII